MEMPKNHIIGLIIALLLFVVLAATVHEVFDVGDNTPLTSDPEFALISLGIMMVVSLGVALVTVCSARHLTRSKEVKGLFSAFAHDCVSRAQAFEIERLLFSPPLTATSLRV
jgi:uncharacterized membrane protein